MWYNWCRFIFSLVTGSQSSAWVTCKRVYIIYHRHHWCYSFCCYIVVVSQSYNNGHRRYMPHLHICMCVCVYVCLCKVPGLSHNQKTVTSFLHLFFLISYRLEWANCSISIFAVFMHVYACIHISGHVNAGCVFSCLLLLFLHQAYVENEIIESTQDKTNSIQYLFRGLFISSNHHSLVQLFFCTTLRHICPLALHLCLNTLIRPE